MRGIDGCQCIADVESRDRARRATPLFAFRLGRSERDHRSMQLVLQFGCDESNHAWVPFAVVDAHRSRIRGSVHARSMAAMRSASSSMCSCTSRRSRIDCIQRPRELSGLRWVVGEQAFDSDCHVFKATGRIDARRNEKADIARIEPLELAACDVCKCAQARLALTLAQAPHSSRYQHAIVRIQRHHVGDRSDLATQVEQRSTRSGSAIELRSS